MFLTLGAMPHESLWKVWLGAANGMLPRTAAAAAACGEREPSCNAAARSAMLQARPALTEYWGVHACQMHC